MITFKKVRFKNFGSFGNAFTEIDLDNNNMTLVSGNNGHGKSFALLDSITFGLFGKPFRKINIPQLPNSINEKDCMVEVEFHISDDRYLIKRGLKPKVFEIYKNDILIDQSAKAKDYQKMLEEQILRMNYKSFTQVVILGSSSFVPFMQLPAADRRDVIEDLLDINVFSLMNVLLKSKVSQLKEEEKELEYEISITKEKIKVHENHITKVKKKSEESIEEIQRDIEVISNEKVSIEKDLIDLSDKIEQTKKFLEQENTLLSSMNKIKGLRESIEKNIKTVENDISFYENNKTCPTCTQEIREEHRSQMLSGKQRKLEDFSNGLSMIHEKVTKIERSWELVRDKTKELPGLEIRLSDMKTELSLNEERMRNANRRIESLNTEEAQVELDNLKKLREDLVGKETEKKKNMISMQEHSVVASLLKDTGIKSKIIKHYLPVMNKLINKYLSAMDFFAQFHLDENFNETIKSRHRDEFSYMSFSEGEKMRIDLALLLSWREIARLKNSANTNLLILDEVFDSSLDSLGTDEFMKLLYSLGRKVNVFIITHKTDQLSDKFEHSLTFEKKNNFSKLTSA